MKVKTKRTIIGILTTVCLLLGAVILLIPTKKKTPTPLPATNAPAFARPSPEQLQVFFAEHMEQPLLRELPSGTFRIPEIQQHFNELKTKIKRNDGNDIGITFVRNYDRYAERVLARADLNTNGVPVVELYVAAIMDAYNYMKQNGARGETLELFPVIIFLHEMQHHAYGYRTVRGTLEENLHHETMTWALTCEHVLEPLVRRGIVPTDSNLECYTVWVGSGRNAESPMWKAFMLEFSSRKSRGM